MNDDVKKKMLDKVRKLLALATSSNENEAAIAAEKAQALLAEYNISMAEVGNIHQDNDDDIIIDEMDKIRMKPWRRPLAQAVAQMYFCSYFYVNYGKKDKHSFVGTEANTTVTKMMFKYLVDTIETLAVQYAERDVPTISERGRYRRSFRTSCTLRLCSRIRQRIEEAKRGEIKGETGRALVLASMYDQWALKTRQHLESTLGAPRVVRSVMRPSDAAGTRAGYEAGDKIGLDQQMNGTKSKGALPMSNDKIVEQIKLQFRQSELDYLGAVEALIKEANMATHEAEDLVEHWENNPGQAA